MRDTEDSGVPKHSTTDSSRMQWLLAPPASVAGPIITETKQYKRGNENRRGTSFVNGCGTDEDEEFGKREDCEEVGLPGTEV